MFLTTEMLSLRMFIHTGDKPHHCDTFNKSFKSKHSLSQYLRIHNGDKSHSFETCGYIFVNIQAYPIYVFPQLR